MDLRACADFGIACVGCCMERLGDSHRRRALERPRAPLGRTRFAVNDDNSNSTTLEDLFIQVYAVPIKVLRQGFSARGRCPFGSVDLCSGRRSPSG